MRKVQTWLFALLFAVGMGGAVSAVMIPTVSLAVPACDHPILTIPPWYKDLTQPDCTVMSPSDFKGGVQGFIWKIVLNVIEILLNLVAYITVGFIIYGGFKYMLATGSPDGINKAKSTILNAVIGLVLSIASIAIVNLISGAIG